MELNELTRRNYRFRSDILDCKQEIAERQNKSKSYDWSNNRIRRNLIHIDKRFITPTP